MSWSVLWRSDAPYGRQLEYDIDTDAAGTGRGDRIAHGEQVQDVFNFYVVDGWRERNEITLRLNIEGRNDAPQMVSNARTEAAGRPEQHPDR